MGYVPPHRCDDRTSNFWYPHRQPCCRRREQPDGSGFMLTAAIVALCTATLMLGMWIGSQHAEPPAAEAKQ